MLDEHATTATGYLTRTDQRTSRLLIGIAAVALLANLLLASPPAFSKKQQQDTSLLKPIVTVLSLGGKFPTVRGVEIRNLFFYGGAALLLMIAGVHLASSTQPPRMTMDDLFDLRSRATGPFFWWGLMLLVSGVTSVFSHAPDVCEGQVIIRWLFFAWWFPLAAFLAPRHVRGLAVALLAAVTLMASVGLWYYVSRVMPDAPAARLKYPIGNELWMGACLLPVVFVSLGLLLGYLTKSTHHRGDKSQEAKVRRHLPRTGLKVLGALAALIVVLIALQLTRSRSALVGMAAGIVVFAFFMTRRGWRSGIVLIGLLTAISGALYVQHLRTAGKTGERAHSIRTRLNHEWPYALTLFFQKPVGGYGDGCYAMLAGQFARDDQLDDPSTLAFDGLYWTNHAHNEILELMADIGLAGTLSFLLAIGMTLWVALSYCDRLRREGGSGGQRWLAIGLATALVAMLVEECSNIALREPGFPPIFLTVWAVLWALIRTEPNRARRNAAGLSDRQTIDPSPDADRLGLSTLRLAGAAAILAAVVLGYFGIQNWRAARARFVTKIKLAGGEYPEAIEAADFAAAHALDPFQKLSASFFAVRARSEAFYHILNASEAPLTDEQLKITRQAWMRLNRIQMDAPRFLGVSRLAWELSLNMSVAFQQRGENKDAKDYFDNYIHWLEMDRADEPFQIELVQRLWNSKRNATGMERLTWLRCLLRRGEMSPGFSALVQSFGHMQGSMDVMNDLVSVARQDASRTAAKWQDRLSPETLRIAALAKDWSGQPEEAVIMARQAEGMYAKAGSRLFAARAAAVHESVRYLFHSDPTHNTDEMLKELSRAHAIRSGLIAGETSGALPLPDGVGRTRLQVLLAADRQPEALAQLAVLQTENVSSPSRGLAIAYAGMAKTFSFLRRDTKWAIKWARRATELDGDVAEAHQILIELYLQNGNEVKALEAATHFIDRNSDPATVYPSLLQVESRWPGDALWDALRRHYPDYPPAQVLRPKPTAATGPANDETGGD